MAGRKGSAEARLSSIAEVLQLSLARVGLDRRLEDYRIFEGWDEVVGPTIARNAQPCRLDERRLVVVVRSSAWLQELGLLRRDLCRRLNQWMGREVIGEIFFVVGKLDPQARSGAGETSVSTGSHEEEAGDSAAGAGSEDGGLAPAEVSRASGASEEIAAAFERLWRAARRRT